LKKYIVKTAVGIKLVLLSITILILGIFIYLRVYYRGSFYFVHSVYKAVSTTWSLTLRISKDLTNDQLQWLSFLCRYRRPTVRCQWQRNLTLLECKLLYWLILHLGL